MCIYVQDMKFLWSNLLLGGLSTDDANTNNDDNDDNDAGHHTTDNSWLHRLICYQQMSQTGPFLDDTILNCNRLRILHLFRSRCMSYELIDYGFYA